MPEFLSIILFILPEPSRCHQRNRTRRERERESRIYLGKSETCRQDVRKNRLDTQMFSSAGKPQFCSDSLSTDWIRPTQVIQDYLLCIVKTVGINHTFTANPPVLFG